MSSINQGNATATVPSTVGLTRGQSVKGPGIPEGASISTIVSGTQFTLSATATQSNVAAPLAYSSEPIFGGKLKTTTTSGTRIVVANTLGLTVGQPVSGNGIPANAKITGILDDNTFEISSAVTSTGTEMLSYGVSQHMPGTLLASSTAGSPSVTVPSAAGLSVGQAITGMGIPDGTRIAAIRNDTEIVLSTASLFTGTSNLAVAGSAVERGDAASAPSNLVFNGGNFAYGSTWVLGGTNGYTGGTTISGGVLSTTGAATRADAPLTLNGGALRYTGGVASSAGDANKQAQTTPGNIDYFAFGDYNGVASNNNRTSGKADASYTTPVVSGNIVGDITLGNQSRSQSGNSVVHISGHKAVTGTFDAQIQSGPGVVAANGGNNTYFHLLGFSETIGGIADYSGSGVIENTEGGARATEVTGTGGVTMVLGGDITIAPLTLDAIAGGRAAGDSGATVQMGTGGITKTGAGHLILSGSNSYTGATTVNAGVLRVANGTALGGTGGVAATQTVNGSTTTAVTSRGGDLMSAPTVTTRSGQRAEITITRGRVTATPAKEVPLTVNSSGTGSATMNSLNLAASGTTGSAIPAETPAIQSAAINGTANTLTVDSGNLELVGGNRGNPGSRGNRSGNATITPDSIDGLLAGPATEAPPQFFNITSGGITTSSPATRTLSGSINYGGTVTLNGNTTYLDTGDPISTTRSGPAPAAAAVPATSMAGGKDLALATDKKKENTWAGGINGSIAGAGNVQANGGTMDLNGMSATQPPVGLKMAGAGDISITDEFKTYTGTTPINGTAATQGNLHADAPAQTRVTKGIIPWTVVNDDVAGGGIDFATSISATPAAPAAGGLGVSVMGAGRVTLASNSNTYSGTTTVAGGMLAVGSTTPAAAPPAFSARPNLPNGIIGGWATTDAGASLELQGDITIGSGSLLKAEAGAPQTGSGSVPTADTTLTLGGAGVTTPCSGAPTWAQRSRTRCRRKPKSARSRSRSNPIN